MRICFLFFTEDICLANLFMYNIDSIFLFACSCFSPMLDELNKYSACKHCLLFFFFFVIQFVPKVSLIQSSFLFNNMTVYCHLFVNNPW